MTIPLVTSGGVMTRLGHIFGAIDDIISIRGSAGGTRVTGLAAQLARVNQFEVDFAASVAAPSVVDGFYQTLLGFQSAVGGYLAALSTLAANTLIYMANLDVKLTQLTVTNAINLLNTQLLVSADTVKASVVTAGSQTSVGSPTGNPVIVMSTKDQSGKTVEYAVPETFTFATTQDAGTGATANQEPVSIAGQAAVADPFSYLWPGGSNTSQSVNLIDATLNGSGTTTQNLLNNSDYETFTNTNVPDNWTIATGTVTTNVLDGGSLKSYTGSHCLEFLGDVGGTLTAVTQTFNTTPATGVGVGGTAGKLLPLTQYAISLWIMGGDALGAGVLEVALIDGAAATITDLQSVANLFTKNLNTVTTSYVNVTGIFRTPAVLPSSVKLRIRLSTALANTKILYIDHVAMAPMTRLYVGGPWVTVFSASTKPTTGDTWTMAVTNTWGKFQQKFEQCFGMKALGLNLNSTSGNTINDNLIL